MTMHLRTLFYEIKSKKIVSVSLFAAFIFPLILFFGLKPLNQFIITERFGAETLPLAVVDLEKSFYTTVFINELIQAPGIQSHIDVVLADEGKAHALLAANQIAGIVIIPADFTHSMEDGPFTPMEFHMNPRKPLQAKLIKEGLDSGAYLMSAVQNALYMVSAYLRILPISPETFDSLFQAAMLKMMALPLKRGDVFREFPVTPWGDAGMEYYYLTAILIAFIALMGCRVIWAYHENDKDYYLRLRVAGALRLIRGMGGFCYGAILLTIYGAGLGVPLKVLAAGRTTDYLLLLLIIGGIAISLSALGVFVAFIARNRKQALLIWLLFVGFNVVISGMILPLHFLPDFVPAGLRLVSPFYWWQSWLLGVL